MLSQCQVSVGCRSSLNSALLLLNSNSLEVSGPTNSVFEMLRLSPLRAYIRVLIYRQYLSYWKTDLCLMLFSITLLRKAVVVSLFLVEVSN